MPIVVRLDGTNAEDGRRILAEAAHPQDRARRERCSRRPRRPPTSRRRRRMSMLVDERTRASSSRASPGNEGTFHTLRNRAYGTNVVAGVTPGQGRAGRRGDPGVRHGRAMPWRRRGANTSMIFVPPRFAAEAILEAADAGVRLVVCITEGIPVRDMANVHSYLEGSRTGSSGPTAPASSRRARRTSGSSPARSARRDRSGSCRGAARSCTRSSTS